MKHQQLCAVSAASSNMIVANVIQKWQSGVKAVTRGELRVVKKKMIQKHPE